MKDIHTLIDYLTNTIDPENVHQAAIILHLLENGGRATKHDLIGRLAEYNDALTFYYESVLARQTDLDLAEQDAFTYDTNSENYFLNFSLTDTFLVETATKLCRRRINEWHDHQAERQEADTRGGQKLVRDLIPDIIASEGRTPVTESLTGDMLQSALLEKLTEEHLELLVDTDLNEISDMIEVLLAIGATLGHDEQAVLAAVHDKRERRGAFDNGVFLKAIHPAPQNVDNS
jgi:predicted house-cleaning noncanonical NTP pyrophosphatase (MazG superfamily)